MSIDTLVTDSGKFMYENFHFPAATSTNGFIFFSGVIGTPAKGGMPEELKDEFRSAWTQIRSLLTEAARGPRPHDSRSCDAGPDPQFRPQQ